MKLEDLRSTLKAEKVNLYIETGKPIKFEIWGLDDKTNTLAEYREVDTVDIRKNDTMFLDYGMYNIGEIGIDKGEALYIGISI